MAGPGPSAEWFPARGSQVIGYGVKNTFIHVKDDEDKGSSDGYQTPPRSGAKARPPLSCPPAVLGGQVTWMEDERSTRSSFEEPDTRTDTSLNVVTQQEAKIPASYSSSAHFSPGMQFPISSSLMQASPGTPVSSSKLPVGLQQTPPPVSPLRSYQQGALFGIKEAPAPAMNWNSAAAHAMNSAAANAMILQAMQLGFQSYAASLAATPVMPVAPCSGGFAPPPKPPQSMPMFGGSASFSRPMAPAAMPFVPGSAGYAGAIAPPQPPSHCPGMNRFKLQLRKVDGGRMGLNATIDASGFLKVLSVDESSAMGSYNKQVKGSQKPSVRPGDIILSVNGVASTKDMVQQLGEKTFVSLEIAQRAV